MCARLAARGPDLPSRAVRRRQPTVVGRLPAAARIEHRPIQLDDAMRLVGRFRAKHAAGCSIERRRRDSRWRRWATACPRQDSGHDLEGAVHQRVVPREAARELERGGIGGHLVVELLDAALPVGDAGQSSDLVLGERVRGSDEEVVRKPAALSTTKWRSRPPSRSARRRRLPSACGDGSAPVSSSVMVWPAAGLAFDDAAGDDRATAVASPVTGAAGDAGVT